MVCDNQLVDKKKLLRGDNSDHSALGLKNVYAAYTDVELFNN